MPAYDLGRFLICKIFRWQVELYFPWKMLSIQIGFGWYKHFHVNVHLFFNLGYSRFVQKDTPGKWHGINTRSIMIMMMAQCFFISVCIITMMRTGRNSNIAELKRRVSDTDAYETMNKRTKAHTHTHTHLAMNFGIVFLKGACRP